MAKEEKVRKKTVSKVNVKPVTVVDRSEFDKHVIDLVMRTLYNNADKDVLHLEEEIYKPANVQMPIKEAERLWEVMLGTGLVNPIIGFGNSGKLELSRTGYQLMAQYGGYLQYMATLSNQDQPQQIDLPDEDNNGDCTEVTPPDSKKAEKKETKGENKERSDNDQ